MQTGWERPPYIQPTQQVPWWSGTPATGSWLLVRRLLVRHTRGWSSLVNSHYIRGKDRRCKNCQRWQGMEEILTARPQIGILPTKQCVAPKANALKISDPRRIPPSRASGILPAATGAQALKESSEAGTPSSWRPPWLEITMPSTPYLMASSTSSGEYTLFLSIISMHCMILVF